LGEEARGFITEKGVLANGRKLTMYSIEYVIKRSRKCA
jgi:hypothetical protein